MAGNKRNGFGEFLIPENVEIARKQGLTISPDFGANRKEATQRKKDRDAEIKHELENLTLLPADVDVPEFIRQHGGFVMWRRSQLKDIPERSVEEFKACILYEMEVNRRSIIEITTLQGMPYYEWIVNERAKDPDFDKAIRLIQEQRALELRDFLVDVIKNPPMTEEYNAETNVTVKKVDQGMLQHRKIAADIAKWLMTKELKSLYGDNIKIEQEATVKMETIDKFAQIGIESLDTEEEYQGVIEKRLANLNPEIAGLMAHGNED